MKRFAYSFLLATIQIFLNKDLWAPQSLIQNKFKLSFFFFYYHGQKYEGENQNHLEETTGAVYS